MVRWMRWHCPPDTGFEIWALAVRGRARSRRLPTIHVDGEEIFLFLSNRRDREPNPELVKGSGANHYPRAPAHIGIGSYRTLAVVELQSTAVMSYVTWSCEKRQTLFLFRAIWEDTAHIQWIRCSPKGSHLIHWTSAVFSHIALKWT